MSTYTWPVSTPAVTPSSGAAQAAQQGTDDLFGKDILFLDDFKLTAAGDYATVSGEENLKRAIYRRLLTKPGEYAFRPEYGAGVGVYVKKAPTQANLDALRQTIIEQLLQDPRIEDVVEVSLSRTLVNTAPVVKVYVRVRAFGRDVRFEPLTYAEEK